VTPVGPNTYYPVQHTVTDIRQEEQYILKEIKEVATEIELTVIATVIRTQKLYRCFSGLSTSAATCQQ
jgi:hypothetical protein